MDTKVENIKDNFSDINQKTQKLVTAIYMVSELVHEQDPIRKKLRDLSVTLTSLVGGIAIESGSLAKKTITEAQNTIDQILNMLKVTVTIGFVSDMNFKIMSDYLVNVRDDLNKKYIVLNGNQGQNATFHNKAIQEFVLPKHISLKEDIANTAIREETNIPVKHNFQVKVIKDKKITVNKSNSHGNQEKSPNSERLEKIIEIVANKKEVSVTDVKQDFPELSEKTVQRMLVHLVDTGKLSKTGEKRWSRYSIVS